MENACCGYVRQKMRETREKIELKIMDTPPHEIMNKVGWNLRDKVYRE